MRRQAKTRAKSCPPAPPPPDIVDDTVSTRPIDGAGPPIDGTGGERNEQPTFDTPGVAIPIPPQYPQRCIQKQAEGVVIVRFDVTERGEVVNARIIQSPDSCFDGPVLRAVQKWRYSPNVKDGVPQPRSNVTEQFKFELQE